MGLATKQDILAILQENRTQLRSLGVRRLGLFGSFVRGEQRVDSDIDFLVEFEPDRKTFDHFMNLAVLLEDLVHRRIELVTTAALSPDMGPHIMGGAPRLYSRGPFGVFGETRRSMSSFAKASEDTRCAFLHGFTAVASCVGG